jgi:hypothetical protein
VNPVNAIDPSGEVALIEFSTLTGKIAFAAFLGATYGVVGKVTCKAASGETITLKEIAIAGLFGAAVPVIVGLATASLSIGAYGFLWTTKINPFVVKPLTGAVLGCDYINIIVNIL